MNVKQILVGIFTASLFSLSVATEANPNLPDSLSGAPKWLLSVDNEPFSAIGSAQIKNNNLDYARSEAIYKARIEIEKMIQIFVNQHQIQDKKDIEQAIKASQVASFWINNDGSKVYVLVKMPMSFVEKIKKIQKDQKIGDDLPEIPEWVIQMGDGLYSAVGSASIIRTTSEKDDEKRELWDIEMAEIEAIHKAKNELYKQFAILTPSIFYGSEVRISKKGALIKESILKLEKIIDTAEPIDLWIDYNRHRVYVLIKLPQYSIAKIRELRKFMTEQEKNIKKDR